MKQEEKSILLADLCARLPYGVIVQFDGWNPEKLSEVDLSVNVYNGMGGLPLPYLRPMSSMTEEEKNEYLNTFKKSIIGTDEEDGRVWTVDSIDWLNAHHFDYRGLNERGLAIEVTEENNPYAGN